MWVEEPGKKREDVNEHVDYHVKSRLFNMVTFFLEFYRLRCREHRKQIAAKEASDFEPTGRALMGAIDMAFMRFLTEELQREGKKSMINAERCIIVMRTALEVVKMTHEVLVLCECSSEPGRVEPMNALGF